MDGNSRVENDRESCQQREMNPEQSIPQALKLTVPPMASVYVIVIKSTAILSVIGISELTRQGEVAIMRMPGDIMFIYLLIATFYFVYCYPVLRFSKWAESRFGSVGNDLH